MQRHWPWYSVTACLVLGLVGAAVAWRLPRGRHGTPPPPHGTLGNTDRELLHFRHRNPQDGLVQAIWELDRAGHDTGYALEIEPNMAGSYCFPFENVLDEPVELGFMQAACDCTAGEVCLLPAPCWQTIDRQLAQTPWAEPDFAAADGADPPEWHGLSRQATDPCHVPARGHGLLRIRWDGRKNAGSRLRIYLRFWSRPVATPQEIRLDAVSVPVVASAPLRIAEPQPVALGTLGPGETRRVELTCWSPTREQPRVAFRPLEESPLFQVAAQPLTPSAGAALQARLRAEGVQTRVRAAYHLTATIREQMAGSVMDQGPFARSIALTIDELPADATVPLVTLRGFVKGDVQVGAVDDQGQVQLGTFPAGRDRIVTVPLRGDPARTLEPVSTFPAFVKAELHRNAAASSPQRAQWDLKITLPAGAWTGALPDTSNVTLRLPGGTPRLIRIPVVGTATR